VHSADADGGRERGLVYLADSEYTSDDWYTNGHFCCFDFLLTVFGTLLVHGWYSLGRHVTIGTPMVIMACQ